MKKKKRLNDKVLYSAFKDDEMKEYQEEAKQRWGHTDAYKQSMTKVGKMTTAEMQKLKEEGKAFTQKLADNMHKGPTHKDFQALIAQHHKNIEFFYPCSYEMYRNLGKMYVDDLRFTAYYDKFANGLAQVMKDAIDFYCDTTF